MLASISRLASDLLSRDETQAATALRGHLATWRDARDLVSIGAYARGSDAAIDRALDLMPAITAFLRQDRDERTARSESMQRLRAVVQLGGGETPPPSPPALRARNESGPSASAV